MRYGSRWEIGVAKDPDYGDIIMFYPARIMYDGHTSTVDYSVLAAAMNVAMAWDEEYYDEEDEDE